MKKILIIDDNSDICEIFRMVFEAEGFETKISLKGMDGIMESLEFKPDVILLDIMMPGMDGFEVLGALRNNSSMDILIIIHSCLDKQSDIDHAFDLGADDYIVKSNRTPDQVVERVRELLQEKEKSGEMQNEGGGSDLLGLFFSERAASRYRITGIEKKPDATIVSLEEKETSPQKKREKEIRGGDLAEEKQIQGPDFQGKPLFFFYRSRKWYLPEKEKVLLFSLVQKEGEMDILESETSSFDL